VSTNEGNISTLTSATSSYLLNTSDTLVGDLTVTGTITAQEFHTEFVSASILYDSGSTKFGDSLDDVHSFTGSASITGSLTVSNNIIAPGKIFANGDGSDSVNPLSIGSLFFNGGWVTNRLGTDQSYNIDLYNSGTNVTALKILQSGAATFSNSVGVGAGITIGTSGTNDISWGTAGGIKLSRTNVGPEYALSQRWTGTLAYVDIAASTEWNGGVTILPNGGGNVGIGTAGPVSKLHVVGDGDTVTLQKSNNIPAIAFLGTSTNKSVIEGGDNFNFYTGGSSRVYITNGGNVGIGTTAPSSKLNLQIGAETGLEIYQTGGGGGGQIVLGTNFGGGNTFTINPYIWGVNNGGFSIRDVTVGENRLVIMPSSGNVGIGTTSPQDKLDVNGSIRFRANTPNFTAVTDNGVLDYVPTSIFSTEPSIRLAAIGTASVGANIRFLTGTSSTVSEKVRITDEGNVGIGTDSPQAPLHIGNGSSQQQWIVNQSVAGWYSGIKLARGAGDSSSVGNNNFGLVTTDDGLTFKKFSNLTDSQGSTYVVINNSGNVGIGTTSPNSPLHVVGRVNTNRIVSDNLISGNIRSNLTTTSYLLLVDLNNIAGYSMSGTLNAASYTVWNVSTIYVRKDYSATTGAAAITGISKSGCDLSVVDISYAGNRYIALKLTGNPEIDVMWTGYRLADLFNSNGTIQTLTSGVTENSTYASY
jgi:hypothetical protein